MLKKGNYKILIKSYLQILIANIHINLIIGVQWK
jgi:hypothetical protein